MDLSTGPLKPRVVAPQCLSLIADLSPPDCAAIISCAQEKRFYARDPIFLQGDSIRDVIVLTSGCVKVTQMHENGLEVILSVNGPADIVGTAVLGTVTHHASTATAVQRCTGLSWSSPLFESLLERFPAFRRKTAHAMEERLLEMEQRFREVCTERVGSRLSSALLRLTDHLEAADEKRIELTLSRTELAQLTGTTLFTVSRLLRKWQAQGIVKLRRASVVVQDYDALMKLSRSE